MQGLSLGQLQGFAEVARRRSFAKAAAQLGLSRSALSDQIRALEERLGVRLLNRTTRSVAPTLAGERLLARLGPALDDLAAAIDGVNADRDTPAGLLRLTVPPPISPILIEPLLGKFMAEHPRIRVEVSLDAVLVDIVRERFDAGIRLGSRIDRDMIALKLRVDLCSIAAAAPAYLARHGTPTTPADLQSHRCIRIRFPSGVLLPWIFERGSRRLEVDVEPTLVVNNGVLMARAAVDGVGIAYGLTDEVAGLIARGDLVPVLPDWQPRMADFHLYYPSRRQMPAALKAFIAFLRRENRLARG